MNFNAILVERLRGIASGSTLLVMALMLYALGLSDGQAENPVWPIFSMLLMLTGGTLLLRHAMVPGIRWLVARPPRG